MSTNENALTAHVQIDDLARLPEIKKNLKTELDEHNIKHSTLEFELSTENCSETTL
jgi:cobalt-zinc-cadmium efflux system protein